MKPRIQILNKDPSPLIAAVCIVIHPTSGNEEESTRLLSRQIPTVYLRAILACTLSAEKEPDGAWKIQVVELERVYSLNGNSAPSNGHSLGEVHAFPQAEYIHSTDGQQVLIEQLQLRLQEVMEARDALVAAKDEVIGDLRQRLDQSQAQVSQLSAVIAQLQPAKAKVGWWQRLLGGGE